jgi:hypothetical protein
MSNQLDAKTRALLGATVACQESLNVENLVSSAVGTAVGATATIVALTGAGVISVLTGGAASIALGSLIGMSGGIIAKVAAGAITGVACKGRSQEMLDIAEKTMLSKHIGDLSEAINTSTEVLGDVKQTVNINTEVLSDVRMVVEETAKTVTAGAAMLIENRETSKAIVTDLQAIRLHMNIKPSLEEKISEVDFVDPMANNAKTQVQVRRKKSRLEEGIMAEELAAAAAKSVEDAAAVVEANTSSEENSKKAAA